MDAQEETPPLPQRPARRKEPKKEGGGRTKAVAVNESAFNQVLQQSKKLKMSKSKYASAAIAFFAESGLDPTEERPQGLGEIGAKVSAETLAVRKQNVDIGNRFISIIRTWEANLYGFMKQQELAQNTYLAAIERNLLERVVAMETNFLGPMVEQLLKTSIEAYVGRTVGEWTYLKVNDKKPEERPVQHASLNKERDQILGKRLEEFAAAHPPVRTTVTPKPALTPVPTKPAASPTGAAAAPATPDPASAPKP
jgi:hypothetical protein